MENYFENKLVVVTGGSGFIGSHFLNELIKRKILKVIKINNIIQLN